MTDASLMVLGAVLMQLNANGDMQPCGYLSQMFFSAKHNYDIFDCELPAIIHGLEEWRQYLLRSPFSIEVLTDHKNLIYFKEPWKRPQRQAQWLLFLQDFNMVYHALSGTQMAYTDALSCRDAGHHPRQHRHPTSSSWHIWPATMGSWCSPSGQNKRLLLKWPTCPPSSPPDGKGTPPL